MKRPFHHNLVKVKNKQFFGVVQNVNYFYKGHYLASSILAFYLDPYFGYLKDGFDEYIADGRGTEEDWFKKCRIEKEIGGKMFFAAVKLQHYGYLKVNSYLEENWKKLRWVSYLPSFSSIYHFDQKPNSTIWLSPLREKLKDFFFFYSKEFFPDVIELLHKFNYQLEKRKGEIYDLDESLVDHFSPFRRVDLDPFFSEEELRQLIYGMSRAIKPEYYNNNSFITSQEEYKELLLDFYGEKGSCCKYTNFNEEFLFPYKTIEELMYVDWISGVGAVAERSNEDKTFPFPYDVLANSQLGWVFLKKLTDSLSKIV